MPGPRLKSAIDAAQLSQGATVLVIGATCGVGTFAVQLAAMDGAHVLASARPGDEALLTELGAAEVVDYTRDLGAAIRGRYPNGVDAVLDFVNRDRGAFGTLAGLARPGGRAVSAVGGAGEATELDGVTVANVGSDAAHWRRSRRSSPPARSAPRSSRRIRSRVPRRRCRTSRDSTRSASASSRCPEPAARPRTLGPEVRWNGTS